MTRCIWTPEKDAAVAEMRAAGLKWAEVAARLDMSLLAVISRRDKLAQEAKARRPWAPDLWTAEEDATLADLWGKGLTSYQIAKAMPGHTRDAILGRRNRLGLARRPSPIVRQEMKPIVAAEPPLRLGGEGPLPAGHPATWGAISQTPWQVHA